MLPRLIRLRDAPIYLGMDKNRFNTEVRNALTEIPVGIQGIAFDRLDLDAWVDHHKRRNGRPARVRSSVWHVKKCPASSKGKGSGISTNKSMESEFAKALALANLKKQKDI